ncbi:MAG: glycosyltransferase family 4 protein [Thermomicrobiales bacterium]
MLGSFGMWKRGTLQSRALPLARSIAARTGLGVAIVTTPWDDPSQAGASETIDGVAIYNTRFVQQVHTPLAVVQQLRILRTINPRVVHIMKPKAFAGLTASALRRAMPDRLVVVDHDDWEGDGGWNDVSGYNVAARRLFDFQERRLIASADAVTAASTLLEERAKRLRRGRSNRGVVFLPNGLDNDWLARLGQPGAERNNYESPALVLYSRFAEFSEKWLARMLIALDSVLAQPVVLHLIGRDEPDRPIFRDLQHIQPTWHGFATREAVPELLRRATVAIYPYEDNLINRSKQSVKLLELMASGCAVVASDVGDIKRVGGDTVIAVDGQDPRAFASAVVQILHNREGASHLGARARERAARFTVERMATRLLRLYESCGVRYL